MWDIEWDLHKTCNLAEKKNGSLREEKDGQGLAKGCMGNGQPIPGESMIY